MLNNVPTDKKYSELRITCLMLTRYYKPYIFDDTIVKIDYPCLTLKLNSFGYHVIWKAENINGES